MENNEPAFPTTLCESGSAGTYKTAYRGLTKRELFAAMAMQGMMAGEDFTPRSRTDVVAVTRYEAQQFTAELAVDIADALLRALAQPGSEVAKL